MRERHRVDGSLAQALKEVLEHPVAVLCVGNPMRGDDAFGPAVAAKVGPRPDVIDAGPTPENELPRVAGMRPRTVLVVDAVHFDGAPGELRVMAPEDLRFDDFSTHAGSLQLCAAFLRQACGARTVLLAAQPVTLDFQEKMSPAMTAAAEQAAALLQNVLARP